MTPPMPRPRVTLLKNYAAAMQHSLNAYGDFVEGILRSAELLAGSWHPHGVYGFMPGKRPGFVAGSIDKYAIAPLEAAFHPADVLHIVDNSNAWYSLTERHRRLVITVHDMIAWKCANGIVEGWNPSPMARAALRLNMIAMHKADALIAVSDTTRRDLLAAGFDASKIRVIHNCILNAPLAPSGERWRGVDLSRTFVHYGAGKFPKHSELVLDAFERTLRAEPAARLILVGPGAATLAQRIAQPGAVETYEQISGGEVRYLYDHVAAILMPSRYEGFGLPVLEAQAASCLIITSDGGALDEVMQDGPMKLKRPIAPDELAATMRRILADEAFCTAMRAAGAVNAARFSRERAQAGYAAFYDAFCA
jgi:glycosyltransferase involved in cell wall biosynthesis